MDSGKAERAGRVFKGRSLILDEFFCLLLLFLRCLFRPGFDRGNTPVWWKDNAHKLLEGNFREMTPVPAKAWAGNFHCCFHFPVFHLPLDLTSIISSISKAYTVGLWSILCLAFAHVSPCPSSVLLSPPPFLSWKIWLLSCGSLCATLGPIILSPHSTLHDPSEMYIYLTPLLKFSMAFNFL